MGVGNIKLLTLFERNVFDKWASRMRHISVDLIDKDIVGRKCVVAHLSAKSEAWNGQSVANQINITKIMQKIVRFISFSLYFIWFTNLRGKTLKIPLSFYGQWDTKNIDCLFLIQSSHILGGGDAFDLLECGKEAGTLESTFFGQS